MTEMSLRMSESELQSKVIEFAKLSGWRCVHILPTEIGKGRWATPYQGDKGLPDLILARDGRVILVELKAHGGKPTLDQRAWLGAAGPNGYLWEPANWDEIERVLGRRRRAAA
jgi:hypothetical protein